MAFKAWHVDNLVGILAAGGGLVLEASSWHVDSLKKLAAAAATSGASLTLTGMSSWHVDSLKAIGATGRGKVVFTD